MLTYAEALKTVMENISPLEAEEKPLTRAWGQVLAEDVCSELDFPMYDTARPDGYAVKSEDIEGADRDHPVVLRIIETVRAGYMPRRRVVPHTTIRIMTGSVVPEGADCVVRFEDTDEPGDKNGPNPANPKEVKIFVSLSSGANVGRAGSNTRKGSLVVPRGTVIGPAQISAVCAVGRTKVKVIRRPVISVTTTGDELVRPGRPLPPGKAYDCNNAAIRALIIHYGGTPRDLGTSRDREADLTLKMQKGLAADAIVTSGGVSKGDFDLVRLVLGKLGKVLFSRIQMGPGASFAFGLCQKQTTDGRNIAIPVFALSGPPAGCLNNFETLVRPALLKMRGITTWEHPAVEAVAEDSVSGKKPMSFIQWTSLEKVQQEYHVKLNNQEGLFSSLATANSLTIIPAGREVRAGEKIHGVAPGLEPVAREHISGSRFKSTLKLSVQTLRLLY